MEGVVHGVKYCQFERAAKINNGIYERNIPSNNLNMSFTPRSVPTRYTKMPILDCRRPTTVPCKDGPIYNQYTTFNPGTSAPYSGFANDIDQESRLQNRFFPLQKGVQSKFIPDSKSDLYVAGCPQTKKVKMTNELLFQKPQFAPFNPNSCNLGNKIFYNNTRLDVRNIPTKAYK